MSLLAIILTLVAVGVLVALIEYIPNFPPSIKKIIYAVVLIVVVVWLMKVFGLWAYLSNVTI
jgi:hypothetical protein